MLDAGKQAYAIYETICTTSADRPFAFRSVEQMHREVAAWQASNPGLIAIRQASPEVLTAFLGHSVEWLKAASSDHSNFRVISTLTDAIRHALDAAPKPLPASVVHKLFTELRENVVARMYFPFYQFLAVVTRDQITDEIRTELRRLHLHYAPSPTGKIDERSQRMRERLAELIYVEGEKQLDPGRGPWSQIVFDEIATKEDIAASAWRGLLEHCAALEQTVPGAKWRKRANELLEALGEGDVLETIERWLALGPTPGQPVEARSPIEDSPYQKGAVWLLAQSNTAQAASAIADFGVACLRKIRMLGAVSQKVGFACVQALGSMACDESVSQLARLRTKVKYTVAQRLIEKSLREAAERSGLTTDELEDSVVTVRPLNTDGKAEIAIGDAKAIIQLSHDGRAGAVWQNADGKPAKAAPSHVKKAFPKEVKSIPALVKDLERDFSAQVFRLEASFLRARTIPAAHWRKHFIEHPLLGLLGRRLIWVFSDEQGWEASGLYSDGEICSSDGNKLDISQARRVGLWHPLSSEKSELAQWRGRVFGLSVKQPFRQAFREFYEVTDGERRTRMHSNRFAGIVMRQHQFSSLCRARGWNYRLMGAGFDGFNVPTKLLASWNMHAEFYVDLPPDRHPALAESGLGEQSGFGINLFLSSDQVRFYRDRKEVAIEDVPAIVYSEVMRDIDLFTSVCAVGRDESWTDQGDRGTGVLSAGGGSEEVSAVFALRIEMLSRVLPLTPIAAQCRIETIWLEVRGQLGTYRIQIPWGSVLRVTDTGLRHLNIPQTLLEKAPLDLSAFPIDLDYRTETTLRKAYVLANDWKIDSPDLIRQLM
jgi:Domain of unknown function (DUF4132)